jgi:hypothetical protein
MTITNSRANFGINCRATPSKSGSSGTIQVGASNETVSLTNTKKVSFDAIIVGSASDLIIDISDLDNTGSTAWAAGTLQVETATVIAASGVTGNGNATVTITSAHVVGSPLAVSVAVTTASTTAALLTTALRAGLTANAAVSLYYTVSGTGADIVLTRKATTTYTLNGTSVPIRPATDATLNIAIANGTCTGITTAGTSTGTTAGVATSGAYVPDLDGNDFEGEATGGLTSVDAVYIKNASTSAANALLTQSTVLADYPLTPGDILQVAGTTGLLPTSDITVEPSATGDESCFVTITLAGA